MTDSGPMCDTRSLANRVRALTPEQLDAKIKVNEHEIARLSELLLGKSTLDLRREDVGALKAGLSVLQIEKRIRERLANRSRALEDVAAG